MPSFNHPSSIDMAASCLRPILAAYEWGWLSIFAASALIAVSTGAIILLVVWLTGGFSGRN